MVPFQSANKHQGNHNTQARIKVRLRRMGSHRQNNVISVIDPSGTEFGRIDMKTAHGLAPLMDRAQAGEVRWGVMTDPRKKAKGEGPPGSPLSALIGVTIQLYCPREFARRIGGFLRSRSIFLEEPLFDRTRYPYENPQIEVNRFPAAPRLSEYANSPVLAEGAPSSYPSIYDARSVAEIRNDVHQMFSTIINSKDLPEMEADERVRTPLLKHQKQALYFMMEHEKDRVGEDDSLFRKKILSNLNEGWYHVITGQEFETKPTSTLGGILADEMGLGKTLSILSLVTHSKSLEAAKEFEEQKPPRSFLTNSRATLLVAPVSTISNWEEQLKSHIRSNSITFTIYHGQNRQKTVQELHGYDLILTTYSTISAEYEKLKPLAKINWFRIVLDEAHAIRTQKTKQSKAVCALWAERRWAVTGTPVQNRLEDLGALFKFLKTRPFDEAAGFNAYILNPFKNADPDVVTKLQLLVSSLTLRRLKQGLVDLPPRQDVIVRLKFSKDEQTLHDWFEQDSSRRLQAVTQNDKLGGTVYAKILSSILNLRLICAHGQELLSDEALKTTEGISWDNAIDISDEPGSGLAVGPPVLNRKQAYDMLELLTETDADKCSACSNKVSRPAVVDEEEEDGTEEGGGGKKAGDKDVLGYMTSCYHIICPSCLPAYNTQISQSPRPPGYAEGMIECGYCKEIIPQSTYELKQSELEAFLQEKERLKRDPKLAKKLGRYIGPHTKTKALLADLEESRKWSEAHPDEPPIKRYVYYSIPLLFYLTLPFGDQGLGFFSFVVNFFPFRSVIFSSWTTHLDLIQIALDAASPPFPALRLDGRMSRSQRSLSLSTFNSDPSIPILLISIAAGGLGLNLTVASRAYVMEPQFNPAAEAQAVDRVHRLGQKRGVRVVRYVMEGSFEEKMLGLQERKRKLADLTLKRENGGEGKGEAARRRLEELRELFK